MATISPVSLPPKEAVEYFRRKGLQPSFAWEDVYAEEHARAFTVAKVAKLDILEDLRSAVDRAIADGTSFTEFKRELIPTLQKKGWWGVGRMVDPKDGEEKEVQLGSVRRLRTIYDVNLRTAHAAGRWEQIERTADRRPYLRYIHLDSSYPRPEHQALHGTVLRIDNPWWRTWYPPNGWLCHCSVQQLGDRDLKRYGYTVAESPPASPTVTWTNPRTGEVRHIPEGISPGFDYNAGIAGRDSAARVLGERVIAAPADLGAAAWAEAAPSVLPDLQRGYGRWVDNIFDQREPASDMHPVGAISPATVTRLSALNQAPASAGVVIRAPDAKRIAGPLSPLSGLSVEQRGALVRRIPSLMASPRAVYFDTARKQLVCVLAPLDGPEGSNLLVRIACAVKVAKKGTAAVNAVVDAKLIEDADTLAQLVGLLRLAADAT